MRRRRGLLVHVRSALRFPAEGFQTRRRGSSSGGRGFHRRYGPSGGFDEQRHGSSWVPPRGDRSRIQGSTLAMLMWVSL